MELLKLLSTNEIIAQIISFLILFFILRAFFWKRILKLLDQRSQRISLEFKNIEEAKAAAEKMRFDYEERFKSIEDAAKTRIQEAIFEGQKITHELTKSAKIEAEKIIADAQRDVRYEFSKAKDELKDEIVDMVLGATECLLEEKITEEKDKQIVEEFIERVNEIK